MKMILTEKTRVIAVTATATSTGYRYDVNYELGNNALSKVNVSIYAVKDGVDTYLGYMNLTSGQKTYQLLSTEEITAHDAMFTSIISEITTALTA
jgi:hypothetical protein